MQNSVMFCICPSARLQDEVGSMRVSRENKVRPLSRPPCGSVWPAAGCYILPAAKKLTTEGTAILCLLRTSLAHDIMCCSAMMCFVCSIDCTTEDRSCRKEQLFAVHVACEWQAHIAGGFGTRRSHRTGFLTRRKQERREPFICPHRYPGDRTPNIDNNHNPDRGRRQIASLHMYL